MSFRGARGSQRHDRPSRFVGTAEFSGALTGLETITKYAGQADFQGTIGMLAEMTGRADFFGTMPTRSRFEGQADFIGVTAAVPQAFANGYSRRARIRVPASSLQFAGTAAFAMFVLETLPELRSAANGGLVQSSSGFDIRFEVGGDPVTGLGGVKQPHIVQQYDPVAGKAALWVRWSVTAGQNNDLFLYIGKTGLVATEANPSGASQDFLQWLNPHTGVDYTGQPGRSLTPTAIAQGDLGLGDAGSFNGSTSVATAVPWVGFGGWPAVTLDCWVQADADAVGTNRTIFAQGPKTAGTDHSIALYWRSASAAGLPNVILGNITCALTTPGRGFTVSDQNLQSAAKMHLVLRWASGQVPELLKDGVLLLPTSSATGTGTVMVQPGNVMLGDGPSTAAFPGLKWKGLIGQARLRAAKINDAVVQTELANQSDPKSFYGIGGFDAPTDSNQSPVAVPEVPFQVQRNASALLDPVNNDFEPDGQGKALTAVDTPSVGSVILSAGKALYTPPAGFLGSASFLYTLADVPGAGVLAKISRGKARVLVIPSTIAPELPTPLRTIWGSSALNTGPGINNTQLTAVLAGDFSTVFVQNGVGGPLQPGDHVMLAPGTFPGNRPILNNGSAANPIVFRAARDADKATILITGLWTVTGNDKIFWGLKFQGGTGRLNLGGMRNGCIRCEITGWFKGNGITFGAGTGCFLGYCSTHTPAPYPSTGDPPLPTTAVAWKNIDRYGIRSQLATVAGFAYQVHIWRCDFFNFPDKPDPLRYVSGQTDAIEIGTDGPSIAGPTLHATRVGGIVTAIPAGAYLNAGWIVEDCVIRDHLEGQGPTSPACFDLKCGGNLIRRIAMRNCFGWLDFRWGPFNTIEDISYEGGSPGTHMNGFGNIVRRTNGGKIVAYAGNMDSGGVATSVPFSDGLAPQDSTYQASQACTIEDIAGGTVVIGQDPTTASPPGRPGVTDPSFPVRNIIAARISTPPAVGNSSLRIGCTYSPGTPAAPVGIPANADVGINATWVG